MLWCTIKNNNSWKKIQEKVKQYQQRKNVDRIKNLFLLDRWCSIYLLSSALQFKCKCQYEGVNWESIRLKYEWMQEIIVESYPKANEESKNFPNLKNCSYIVFFTVYASSLIENLFRVNILCSHQQNYTENHFVADIVSLYSYHPEEHSISTAIWYKKCVRISVKCEPKPCPVFFCNAMESYTV